LFGLPFFGLPFFGLPLFGLPLFGLTLFELTLFELTFFELRFFELTFFRFPALRFQSSGCSFVVALAQQLLQAGEEVHGYGENHRRIFLDPNFGQGLQVA